VILGMDSILFGDILHIPRVGTFILDIAIGDVRSTPQLLVVIHNDSIKPVAIVCEGRPFSTPLMQFLFTSPQDLYHSTF
jgi:hypothetical protein